MRGLAKRCGGTAAKHDQASLRQYTRCRTQRSRRADGEALTAQHSTGGAVQGGPKHEEVHGDVLQSVDLLQTTQTSGIIL
jgi:hypothetical protein